jgi:hypothetical protein
VFDESPAPCRIFSSGGRSKLSGKSKLGKSLEECYPEAFLDVTRANAAYLADEPDINITYPWQIDTNPPSSKDEADMKNKIDWEMRKVFFVYGTNSFACTVTRNLFPHIDTRTMTFRKLRDYANELFKNWKHELLYGGFYVCLFSPIFAIPFANETFRAWQDPISRITVAPMAIFGLMSPTGLQLWTI